MADKPRTFTEVVADVLVFEDRDGNGEWRVEVSERRRLLRDNLRRPRGRAAMPPKWPG